jgi:hypothetical protein
VAALTSPARRSFSFGPSRDTLIDMAREWERLANEQDGATDLGNSKGLGRPRLEAKWQVPKAEVVAGEAKRLLVKLGLPPQPMGVHAARASVRKVSRKAGEARRRERVPTR